MCVIAHAKDVWKLRLNYNENVTGAMLDALRITHNFTLRDVSVSMCPNLDARGVSTLISECGGLRSLSLTRMQDVVTDAVLQEISPFLSSLTAIDLSWNVRVSDQGFNYISTGCHGLKSIKLMVNRIAQARAAFRQKRDSCQDPRQENV